MELNINRTYALYNKVALWVLAGLTLAALLLMRVLFQTDWLTAILIAVVFNYACTIAYGLAWRSTARRSPELLPKFYLAASVLRLLLAAVVILCYCVVVRKHPEDIKVFAIIFILYYLVMLVFDALFFAKISKQCNS